MYVCIHVPDFAAQAALRMRPELRRQAVAVLDGPPPLEKVFAVNPYARRAGVVAGMSRLQAESFTAVHLLSRVPEEEASAQVVLAQCAAGSSPRIESLPASREEASGGTLVLDVAGSGRLLGPPRHIAESLRRKIAAQGMAAHLAASANFHACVCAARGLSGVTVIEPGSEAQVLSPLPLDVLDLSPEAASTFHLWGVRDCGALSRLPENELIARLGQEGKRLRALARGECHHLLLPVETDFDAALAEKFELEHPVDLLEPLLFLIARLIDQLMQRALARALAIASVHLTLTLLVHGGSPPRTHERAIRPALPTQESRTLLKLLQLDLETHPPGSAVVAIRMQAVSAPPHRAQHGLFLPQAPEPGRLEILLARLRRLLGEDRLGAPQLLDAHRPDSFRMAAFLPPSPASVHSDGAAAAAKTALRVCRPPLLIRVDLADRGPVAVWMEGERFRAVQHAGPWRKSGAWWSHQDWCREEWDVVLSGQKREMICRIAHDPSSGAWYLQGMYD